MKKEFRCLKYRILKFPSKDYSNKIYLLKQLIHATIKGFMLKFS